MAQAARTRRDLRIAEVAELDLQIEDGKVTAYRPKVNVSFKFEGGDQFHRLHLVRTRSGVYEAIEGHRSGRGHAIRIAQSAGLATASPL